ncbi:hypothetical protein D2Q93_06150 [Alicyclobacillaceae bacterium I2511]|jgi:predicted Fe-Mo cluster-binding NifX family protein|nr:hypothetical protein D2Q93_06150 [Alicyclobacillaceae bacterium I2511]
MKVAIPTSDGKNISKHVALSKYFYIFEEEELVQKIENPIVQNLHLNGAPEDEGKHLGAGHTVPQLIVGVDVLLAREIGSGMKKNLEEKGIQCLETEEKDIKTALHQLK